MTTSHCEVLGVAYSPADHRQAALELATRLVLPVLEAEAGLSGLQLRISPAGLALFDSRPGAPGAVRVDLRAHLRRAGSVRGEAIARAAGLRPHTPLRVLDATAGLGRDAFILASLGAEVWLTERSPIIAALLADGLERAGADPELAPIRARMRLHAGDARALPEGTPRPEVVYLDPMYPQNGTKGEVKKEMQLLRRLLGAEDDPGALFDWALGMAGRRVVVKRPRRAPPLGERAPNHQLIGRSTRFDVYLTGG